MTVLDGVVGRAKARVEAVEAKGLSYVPQILDAHQKAMDAEKSGHQRSLDCAIAAGDLLLAAKEAVRGQFKWTDWRTEHLPGIPQTTASLYMRLARGKDRLKSSEINNAVAKLAANGELSIRRAATLLADKRPRGTPKSKPKADGTEWLKALAVDELVIVLKEIHRNDTEYLQELTAALTAVLRPPTSAPLGSAERRM